MKLYDSKYVYFDWDDKLEGKKGFFGDSINHIKQNVKDNCTMWFGEISNNLTRNTDYPFAFIDELGNSHCFRFCYCDPYYEFRKAYLEGKQLQFKDNAGNWRDVLDEFVPLFNTDEYRIKPETWYIVLDDDGLSRCNSEKDGKVVFEGTEDECIKWYDKYKSFENIMLAWKQGKTIQFKEDDKWINWMLIDIPRADAFDKWKEWRIKDDVELVPFDTVQELIDAWDNKYPQSSKRPECTMPFIWIKNKIKNRVYLITDFLFDKAYNCDVGTEDSNLKLKELFEDFTFLDGSIIGKGV